MKSARTLFPVDFLELSNEQPTLTPYFKSKPGSLYRYLDLHDQDTLRAVTRAILAAKFNVKDWAIPDGRLIPTLPNRLAYVLLIQDLLLTYRGALPKSDGIIGVDVGTGASMIYPLLMCSTSTFIMIATENDPTSISSCREIMRLNPWLESRVELVQAKMNCSRPDILQSLFPRLANHQPLCFSMCNPPFFNSFDEARRAMARAASKGHSTGSGVPSELVFEAHGEVGFVHTMIKETASSHLTRQASIVYSSMLGKKSSVLSLVSFLKGKPLFSETIVEIPTYHAVKTIRLGRTCRWVLFWSWQPSTNFLADGWVVSESTDVEKSANETNDEVDRSTIDSGDDDEEMEENAVGEGEEFEMDAADEFNAALVDTRRMNRKRKLEFSLDDSLPSKQRLVEANDGGIKRAGTGVSSKGEMSLGRPFNNREIQKKNINSAVSNVRIFCMPMDSFSVLDIERCKVSLPVKKFGAFGAILLPSLKDEAVLRRTRRIAERGGVLPDSTHPSAPPSSLARVSLEQLCSRIDSATRFCASYYQGKVEKSSESVAKLYEPLDEVTLIQSWDLVYSPTNANDPSSGGIMQIQLFLPRASAPTVVQNALIVSVHLYGTNRTSFSNVCDALEREIKQIGRKFRRLEKIKQISDADPCPQVENLGS
jgi:23S rRNA A1618 N6-methylase RlmF